MTLTSDLSLCSAVTAFTHLYTYEVNAVNSENDKNLQNDTWRLNQLDKSTCKTGHPYVKFGTGEFQKYRAMSAAGVIKLAQLCYRKQVLFSVVSVCVCVFVCLSK